jgi:hypothetical protein
MEPAGPLVLLSMRVVLTSSLPSRQFCCFLFLIHIMSHQPEKLGNKEDREKHTIMYASETESVGIKVSLQHVRERTPFEQIVSQVSDIEHRHKHRNKRSGVKSSL